MAKTILSLNPHHTVGQIITHDGRQMRIARIEARPLTAASITSDVYWLTLEDPNAAPAANTGAIKFTLTKRARRYFRR